MNLKLTKTAIRELTRLYRGVLVAAFIASAFVANGANAAINVTTGTTDISADVITTVVANAKLDTVAEAPEVDNPADHLTDTTYAFTKADGSAGKGNDLASTSAASYTGIASSANGSTVSTTTTLSYESGTLAETNYQYKDGQGNWSIYGSGEKTYTDTYTLGEYAGFQELALTGVNGGLSYDLDGTLYQFGVGPTQYTLNDDATKVVKVSDGSETLISSLDDGDLKTAALAAQSEYNGAKTAIQAKQDVIDGYATTEATNYAAAGSTLEADQITVNNLASYKESFDTAKGLYDTDTTAYGIGLYPIYIVFASIGIYQQ